MEPVILSHSSAIRAIRNERRIHGTLHWEYVGAVERRQVLACASVRAARLDFAVLEKLGVWVPTIGDTLHLLVGKSGARSAATPSLQCYVHSSPLPSSSLMRLMPDVYCVSPVFAVLQYSYQHSFAETFSLLMEMMGTYALPSKAASLQPSHNERPGGGMQGSVEQAHFQCMPVIDERTLALMAKRVKGSSARTFSSAAKYVQAGSASPGETIMFGMFSLPMARGGFACGSLPGGMKLNYRVIFGSQAARMASGVPYAICDAYIPAAHTDLEYNGFYHETTSARVHDGNRNNGLRGEDIRVLVINRNQMRDIAALEAIAQSLYKDAHVRFRYRVSEYRLRQEQLLNGLRGAIGLPPV